MMSRVDLSQSGPGGGEWAGHRSSATVLLVDDDSAHRNAIAFDFKRKGYRVLQAGSGSEAWEIIQKEEVHLVITDIRMPDGNGVDLLRRIKDRDPNLPPVILMTGYTDLNLDGATDWGAEAVFLKPFERKELLARSTAILSGHERGTGRPAHE
jgi:DNA-binding response OmpR family regulator